MKSEIVIFRRALGGNRCDLTDKKGNWTTNWFCWRRFREMAPAFCKGLRRGARRELKLTQTKKGIKLERL